MPCPELLCQLAHWYRRVVPKDRKEFKDRMELGQLGQQDQPARKEC
jgi:hypothetical protein